MTPQEASLEDSPPTRIARDISDRRDLGSRSLARREPECQVQGSVPVRSGAARKLSGRMVFTRQIDRPIAGREPPSDLRVIASRHATRRTALRRSAIEKTISRTSGVEPGHKLAIGRPVRSRREPVWSGLLNRRMHLDWI